MIGSRSSGILLEKSLRFAKSAVVYGRLLKEIKEYELASQFIRSATSVGANIHEASHSESRRDFIHKLKLASKEASEVSFWLRLFSLCEGFPDTIILEETLLEIQRMLSKSIETASKNLKMKSELQKDTPTQRSNSVSH
jgi:four helix bundle protein